jgi:Mg2+-importing ATPase
MSPSPGVAYWSRELAAVFTDLGSGPRGLSSDKAAELLRTVGPKSVEEASRLTAARLLLRQFESPLVLILIFGAAISLVLQQWVDSAIILTIVLGSTLLGFVQEVRASHAVERLKQRLALTCRVRRDGVERNVTVRTVVPGDLILLSAGNLIPADGLVVEAQDFLVSEASMTGESFPVEKQPGIVSAKRHGHRPCRGNRPADRIRCDRGAARRKTARNRFRARRQVQGFHGIEEYASDE